MQGFLDAAPWIISVVAGLLMWATQVSPKQAISNVADWAISLGVKHPPGWLKSPNTDYVVRHVAASLLAGSLLYVVSQIFEVANMRFGRNFFFGAAASASP